jgi:alpha-methylacyl-CoA racemase
MNIMLALRQREMTGEGAYLDIAIADNLFTFMYWAIGNGLAADRWPDNGGDLVTGGSPRYHLYDTRDGAIVAAAPLEQKFWISFTTAIGLEPDYVEDTRDPSATIDRVAAIIATRTAAEWASVFDVVDCCCSIVQDVRAALDDPHFAARGLFAHTLTNEQGAKIAALPVPVVPAFRDFADALVSAPSLGAHNPEFGL